MNFFEEMEKRTGRKLNEVQRQAVIECEKPLLLVASPGTGKTTVIAFKVQYLIKEKKIPVSRILAVTFSKESAKDMEKRFATFFGEEGQEKVGFSTIHSFAYQVVRQYLTNKGVGYEFIEQVEEGKGTKKQQLLKELFLEFNHAYPTEEEQEGLVSAISQAKNLLLPTNRLGEIEVGFESFIEIYQAYEAHKKAQTPIWIDYDDMLMYTYQLLKREKELLAYYQNKFDYLLVDEAQDTSMVQYEIIHLLAAVHQRVCFVGDDAQSIYRFRGSLIENMLELPKRYPTMQVLNMEQNYRSSLEIVKTSNEFIKLNKGFPKNMFTTNPSATPVKTRILDSYDSQLRYLTHAAKENQVKGIETAILFRNNLSAIPLMYLFLEEGIAFQAADVKEKRFLHHWLVKEFCAFIRFAHDGADKEAFLKIARRTKLYLKKSAMEWLRGRSKSKATTIWQDLKDCPYVEEWQQRAIGELKRVLRVIVTDDNVFALKQLILYAGYDKSLKKEGNRDAEETAKHIEQVIRLFYLMVDAQHPLSTLENRMKELVEGIEQMKYLQPTCPIILSTFHRSKGLEYANVYMMDLQQGVIPSVSDMKKAFGGDSAWYEESIRLFYVGMTRAKSYLELVAYKEGGENAMKPSEFLEHVEHILNPSKRIPKNIAKPVTVQADKLLVSSKPAPVATKKATKQDISKESLLAKQWNHKKFGVGKVIELKADGDTIVFETENGLQKQISLVVCLKNNLLTMVV